MIQSVDWFRLLWDMTQRDVNFAEVARRTGQKRETLRDYLHGVQPAHWRGELMIELWCQVCDKPRRDIPMCELVIMPRVVKRKDTGDAGKKLAEAWR